MAKKGYQPGSFPEAAELEANSDIILTLFDGYSVSIACLVDRETHPGKTFALSNNTVESIGEACRKYTGRVGTTKMPVFIHIYEIGPAEADGSQQRRLAAYEARNFIAKVRPSGWIVDPAARALWSNAQFGVRWNGQRFIKSLLNSPRENDEALTVAPVAAKVAPSFPWLTVAILAGLTAIFATEVAFGVGKWTGFLQPSLQTLVAFGGTTRALVLASGEWYRLLSAPLLHGDAAHLAMNGVALFLAGRTMEGLIGRGWFAVIMVVSAVCGSLASVFFNPPTIVSVGASGAITGLFAAMLIASLHFPKGANRTGLQMSAVYILIPALLPIFSAGGMTIDYAAHFGGAIGGGLVGFLLINKFWPRDEIRPRFQRDALAFAAASLIVFAYPAIPLAHAYPRAQLQASLIPYGEIPQSALAAKDKVAALVAAYPRDPRAHLMQASIFFSENNRADAERELRAALAEEDLWAPLFPADLPERLKALLAISISHNRIDEAKSIAKPICSSGTQQLKNLLKQSKLCDS